MGKAFKKYHQKLVTITTLLKAASIILIVSVFLNSSLIAIEFNESFLEEIGKKYGDYAKRRLKSWEKLIQENKNKNLTDEQKLEEVNRFFNLLEYQRDINHWGVTDYWATPLEFVVSGAGDCEDFSLAKYFALLELGLSDDKLLIMYVKLKDPIPPYSQAHMVLLYYATPDSVPLVLDNINKEILPADKRTDLIPIYGFNGKGLWQAKELGKGNKIGEASDLKRWADLESRMKSNKIEKWKDEEIDR